MLLTVQIQAILYAFLAGVCYGITFSLKQYITRFLLTSMHTKIVDILYHIIFTLLLYYGLYLINGGESNLYLLLFFIMGIYLYYRIYYPFFCIFFYHLAKFTQPFYYFVYLLFSRFYSIMLKERRKRKHGRSSNKEKCKKKK